MGRGSWASIINSMRRQSGVLVGVKVKIVANGRAMELAIRVLFKSASASEQQQQLASVRVILATNF